MSVRTIGRPVIGVTGYPSFPGSVLEVDGTERGLPGQGFTLIGTGYVESVENAGGLAVGLPISSHPAEQIAAIDGLILTGGEDVDPSIWGAEPHPETKLVSPERDRHELDLYTAATERRIPVLLICRGLQLINVAMGGTLKQHVEGHRQECPAHQPHHTVRLEPESQLARILESTSDEIEVNSYHHQAIEIPGEGVRIEAHADDGTIEGASIGDLIIGVQWHPETMGAFGQPLFRWLVARATERRSDPE